MENQPTLLDKVAKISIIAGALIIALSIAYYFVARPVINEKKLNNCLQEGADKITRARESSTKNNNDKSIADRIIDKSNNPTKYQAIAELILSGEEYKKECFKKYPQ